MPERRRQSVLICALIVGVLGIYAQVYRFGFANLDDDAYVSENPVVLKGLTLNGIRWAFTTGQEGNWTPLTWLSLMLDVQLFGALPGALHAVNVVLHLANSLLLFAVLHRMTRALWPSWIVAALFALHPLHVESVVWISERKDVLSTFFWFLSLGAYLRYVESRSARWYAATCGLFTAGLLAKSMLVTGPFLLLLLDFWPLRRMALAARAGVSGGAVSATAGRVRRQQHGRLPLFPRAQVQALLIEKIPLFAIAILFSALAYATQKSGHAIVASEALPLGMRIANALVAYARYLEHAVWPLNLAVFYPYDRSLPLWQPVAAALGLVATSVLVVRNARAHPYGLVGWFWYLGTLMPVIGIVQIGGQAFADRYTYVPLIGIFIVVVWGARELVQRSVVSTSAVAVVASLAIAAYAILAYAQIDLWSTNEKLFAHAAAVTSDNAVVHNNLGVTLAANGEESAALEEFHTAVRLAPNYADAHNNLGAMLGRQGRREEAAAEYRIAVRCDAQSVGSHRNLGMMLLELDRTDEAIVELTETARLDPASASTRYALATALSRVGRTDEAVAQFADAVEMAPDDSALHYLLGIALIQSGHSGDALAALGEAIRLKPDYAEAYNDRGVALMSLGRRSEAIADFNHALALRPDLPDALENIRMVQPEAAR